MMFFPFPQPAANQDLAHLSLTGRVRSAQIICGAMIIGVLMFMGITLTQPPNPRPPMLAYIGLGAASLMIVIRFIVPGMVAGVRLKQLADADAASLDSRLFEIFQTKMIIGLALLEGAAFFNLVAYLVEQQQWTLAVVGTLVALMAMMFPTLGRFESWAEDIKRDMQNQF